MNVENLLPFDDCRNTRDLHVHEHLLIEALRVVPAHTVVPTTWLYFKNSKKCHKMDVDNLLAFKLRSFSCRSEGCSGHIIKPPAKEDWNEALPCIATFQELLASFHLLIIAFRL